MPLCLSFFYSDYHSSLLLFLSVTLYVVCMESLPHFGVTSELSKEEFVRKLSRVTDSSIIADLRSSLFLNAVSEGLADSGDSLVKRKLVQASL